MRTVLVFVLIFIFGGAKAQKVEKIFVNLYTDSLKKGTYNYINVDGLMSNGKYMPLDSNKIRFSCAQAKFTGNSLFIPKDFSDQKVLIKVALKDDDKLFKEFEVYIKRMEDPPLRPESEVMNDNRGKKRKG